VVVLSGGFFFAGIPYLAISAFMNKLSSFGYSFGVVLAAAWRRARRAVPADLPAARIELRQFAKHWRFRLITGRRRGGRKDLSPSFS
jgi:hypothetical protein